MTDRLPERPRDEPTERRYNKPPREWTDEEYAEPGRIIHHSSDEGGSPDVGLTIGLGGGAHLWIGEITRDRWLHADPSVQALGTDGGWWLILYETGKETVPLGRMGDYYDIAEEIERIAGHLRTNTAALQAARREGMEAAAKAICEWCASGDVPSNYGEPFSCAHKHVEQGRFPTYTTCRAAAIRALPVTPPRAEGE